MGRFKPMGDEETMSIPGPGTFTFSAKKIEKLGASEYTLVTIVLDISGSVANFGSQLRQCVINIVEACRKNQRAEFLVVRFVTFNHEITEIHGFRELIDIDSNDYDELRPDGFTALYDASYDAIGATLEYAKLMSIKDYAVNGAVYIVTDGMENPGRHRTIASPNMIKNKVDEAIRKEDIESLITILVGLHDPNDAWGDQVKQSLSNFQEEAGLTKFIDVGDASAENLAKLVDWVSDSISSQSNHVGSNTPSQVLNF